MSKMSKAAEDTLSRSALADRLGIPLKELTQVMIDSGWIIQSGKNWQLTSKGEFEGGEYRESKKYGQYIVWPVSVIDHPMIRDMNSKPVPVSQLAKKAELPPRLFNRILFDLGWITAFAKGWQLTEQGKRVGGVQAQDEESGNPYVLWPRGLLEHQGCAQALSFFSGHTSNTAIHGLKTASAEHSQIASWLYLVSVPYRYKSPVYFSDESALTPDFYIPSARICVDYCPDISPPDELAQQLLKRERFHKEGFHYVECKTSELSELDHNLSRLFIQHGLTVY